jgi:dihydroxyacetone kinase-like protein
VSEPRPDGSAGMDAGVFLAGITNAAGAVAADKDRLTRLDAAIGDGDHGTNLSRGLTSVLAALQAEPPATPGAVLTRTGMTLISSVGGASGPLYGTFFRRMGRALGEDASVDIDQLAGAFEAGLAGLTKLGGAVPGDKTMVDAISPATDALRSAVTDGASQAEALDRAAGVAEAGARETIPLRARKGRASYLGERSEGHEDPGAASSALLWRTLARTAGAARDGGSGRSGA